MNNHKNTKKFKFTRSQFVKEFLKTTRNFVFYLLSCLSFFGMLNFLLFSLVLITIGIVSIILEIIHKEFLTFPFIMVSMLHVIAIISGVLGLWIWTYARRWRKSATIYWKNRLVFPAISFFFSIFPPIVLFYIPFKNRLYFRLSGRLENLEISPPEAYHDFVLEEMKTASIEAKGDVNKFLKLFEERVKKPVRENPELLTKKGWPDA